MRPHLLAASIAALSLLLAAGARADEPGQDEVSLKNGGTIRGTVVASEPGTSVKIIEMGQKEVRVIPWDQVTEVERGKYAPRSAVPPRPAAPGYGAAPARPLPALTPPTPPRLGDPGVVRLHVDSSEPVEVIDQSVRAYGGYGGGPQPPRTVCTSPCDVVVDGTLGRQFSLSPVEFPPSKTFNFAYLTGDVTLHVSLGSYARRTNGVWMTVLGGTATLVGIVMLPLSFVLQTTDGIGSAAPPSRGLEYASTGVLVGGVAVLAVGIALLTTSSTKVTLDQGWTAGRAAQRAPRYWMGEF